METLQSSHCRAGSGQLLAQESGSSGVSSSSCGLYPPARSLSLLEALEPGRERLWRPSLHLAPASALSPLLLFPWGSQSLCGWVAGPDSTSSRRPCLPGDPPAELVAEMLCSPPSLDAT